ncbi:MAG: hypothetical protein Q7J57_10445 [Gemmobacter sp.]|nr:hypothetical protein [Gemmobacter sp.]
MIGWGMKNFSENARPALKRAEFARQFCLGVGIPIVVMGFYDSQTGSFSESWVGGDSSVVAEQFSDLIRATEARLAIHAALQSDSEAGTKFERTMERAIESITVLTDRKFIVGVCNAIGRLRPAMAFRMCNDRDPAARQALVQIGMPYVIQQLTDSLQAQSSWPEGLLETTFQVLSIEFLVVNEQSRIKFDGRQKSCAAAGPSGWVVCNDRLSVSGDKERSNLEEAIRGATSEKKRTSIISVNAQPHVARLVVVTPLAGSDPPLALIMFESPKVDHSKLREQFFGAYGLTRSEGLIAHEILGGKSVAEAAEATNLSLATARSYMKQVFGKTGVHRQGELISLYYTSILPLAHDFDMSQAPRRG